MVVVDIPNTNNILNPKRRDLIYQTREQAYERNIYYFRIYKRLIFNQIVKHISTADFFPSMAKDK